MNCFSTHSEKGLISKTFQIYIGCLQNDHHVHRPGRHVPWSRMFLEITFSVISFGIIYVLRQS